MGQLYVGGAKQPIAELDLAANREAQKYNGRIVECCWDRVHMKWMFMRLREDKSFPNSYTTAQSECTAQLSTIEPLLFFPCRGMYEYQTTSH